MSTESISDLRSIKGNIKNNVIPKLNELKNQIDICEKQLSNYYKIDDQSADRGELNNISEEVTKMIKSAGTAINTIDNRIDDLEEAARREAERQEAARQEAARRKAESQDSVGRDVERQEEEKSIGRSIGDRIKSQTDDIRRLF